MILVRSLAALPPELTRGAIAIGNFDGVHVGHARLAELLKQAVASSGGPTLAFTFDPHPLALLQPDRYRAPLTTVERRAELLGSLGIDAVIAYPTDHALLQLSAEEFFRTILVERLQAKAIVEGPNFRYGRNRQGDIDTLRAASEAAGIAFQVAEPVEHEGRLVSSSRVRDLLQAGKVGEANQLLTRPFRITGVVERGEGRGATIGFPTANLGAISTATPGGGVYAARAYIAGRSHPAAVNIGPNPTFGVDQWKIEAHVIDFQGDLYGQTLSLDFLDRLRETRPFASKHDLMEQLRADVAEVREMCACSGFAAPSDDSQTLTVLS